jgi:hypothetical protein
MKDEKSEHAVDDKAAYQNGTTKTANGYTRHSDWRRIRKVNGDMSFENGM